MVSGSAETRRTHYVALVASLLMCVVVASANARQQTSSSEAATTKPAQTSSADRNTNSATQKKTGASHRTASSSRTSGTTSSPAKEARTSSTGHHSVRSSRRSKTKRVRGQQKIDSERATSIQEALIHEHYLTGEPTGAWDAASEAAMRRYQSDHGWQTKEVPDSRALIKLGLGPNNDHLLNPDSAMTSTPIARRSEPLAAGAHATASEPATNSGADQSAAKPASVPQVTPAAQPVPASPPKDSDDSANPH